MYEYNPGLKLIYLYRNPLERMRSAYRHAWERGWFSGSFSEFLSTPSPVDVTRYAMQIRPFPERFGRDQVLILDKAELVGLSRVETLTEIERFLGISIPADVKQHGVHANDGAFRKSHHRYDRPNLPLRVLRRVYPRAFRAWAAFRSRDSGPLRQAF